MQLEIRKAERGEGSKLLKLVMTVYEQMPEENRIWFSVDQIEEEAERLDRGENLAYFAVDPENENAVAGAFLVTFPGLSSENLGHYADFSEAQLLKVAHMDTAAVHSAYQGQGLQRRLMEQASEDLRKAGYRYLMCTVHPENPYSYRNLTNMGYRKIWQGYKYHGKLRDVMLKEIG